MMTSTQLESLREALSFEPPPLCSGATSPPPEGFHLWYGKEDPRFIDFSNATPEDLDLLTAACDPATFGRGNEDVHDETYRKAVKMDASNFAVHLDLAGSDLIRTIEGQLLHGEAEDKRIKVELSKLNIYEKGSFFKAHKDTPRGTDMMGSLVVIYPTAHEGGELVLRHKDREWKFDASTLNASTYSPSLAYVSFYSDIEHEILEVTSGRRITITYNLYLVNQAPEPGVCTTTTTPVCAFETMLRSLLKSPDFLPYGGTLGFGLAHLYPISPETMLPEITPFLKGEDAYVYRVCRNLQLRPSLQMIYDDGICDEEYGIMLDRIIDGPEYNPMENGSYENCLFDEGGVAVNKTEGVTVLNGDRVYSYHRPGEPISWVSPFNQRTRFRDLAERYGNEVTVGFMYSSPCMIVRVAAAGDR